MTQRRLWAAVLTVLGGIAIDHGYRWTGPIYICVIAIWYGIAARRDRKSPP